MKKGIKLFFAILLGGAIVVVQLFVALCVFFACQAKPVESDTAGITVSVSEAYSIEPEVTTTVTTATPEETTTATTEDPTKKYFDRAAQYFEKSEYDDMLKELDRLKKKYPETSIDDFIAEKLATLPTIDVRALLDEYDGNAVKADSNYLDRMIIICGTVGRIDKNSITDEAYVYLTDGGKYSLIGARCYLEDDEISKAMELSKGDKVYILGICDGQTIDIMMDDCYIVTEYMK